MQGWILSWWFVRHTCQYKIETADSALTRQLAALTWPQLCGWVPWDSAESPNIPAGTRREPGPVASVGSVVSTQSPPANMNITQPLHPCSFTLWKWGLSHGSLELEEETDSIYIPPSASAGFFRCDRICNTMSKLTRMLTAFLRKPEAILSWHPADNGTVPYFSVIFASLLSRPLGWQDG